MKEDIKKYIIIKMTLVKELYPELNFIVLNPRYIVVKEDTDE